MSAPAEPSIETPQHGEIFIEYHPNSGKSSRRVSLEEFKEGMLLEPTDPEQPEGEPWNPFVSREDFEFAEIAHRAKLNQSDTDALIDLIHRCRAAPGSFTLRNQRDMEGVLKRARKLFTDVRSSLYLA